MSFAVVTPLRSIWMPCSIVPAYALSRVITGFTWEIRAFSHSHSVYCEPMPVMSPSLKCPCVFTKPGVTRSCAPPRTVAPGCAADSSANVPTAATRSPSRSTAPSRIADGVSEWSGAAVSTHPPRIRVWVMGGP